MAGYHFPYGRIGALRDGRTLASLHDVNVDFATVLSDSKKPWLGSSLLISVRPRIVRIPAGRILPGFFKIDLWTPFTAGDYEMVFYRCCWSTDRIAVELNRKGLYGTFTYPLPAERETCELYPTI